MKTLLTFTTAALIGVAGLASAQDSAFGLPQTQPADGVIEFDLVNSEAEGMVEIYAIDDTAFANPLGSQMVSAGANEGVMVTLTAPPPSANSDLVAVLKVGDAIVAQQTVDIDSDSDSDDENSGDDATEPEDGGEGEGSGG